MAYFRSKEVKYRPRPIPPIPPYVPPTPPTPPTPEAGNVPVIPRPVFSESAKLRLYQTASENAALDKQLYNMIEMDIVFKDDTSAQNPIIIVESEYNLTQYNYAHIDITGRYYYVRSDMLTGNMFRLYLTTDELMSFNAGIKNLIGIIRKTQDLNYINNDLNDGSFVNQEGTWKEIKDFENGFNESPNTILIAAGRYSGGEE